MQEFIYFIKGFFGAPAVTIGLFSMFGAILQRKTFTDIVITTIKAAIGYLILIGGIGILSGTLTSFTVVFNELFGLEGVMGNADALAVGILNSVPDIATVASLMMLLATILNVILAKFTRFKYIFLTGHHTLYICVLLSAMFQFAGLDLVKDMWYCLVVGSLIVSIYMLLSPALSKPYMEKLTQDDKIYIAHANAFGYAVAGWTGDLVGKIAKGKVKSTEEIRFPKGLKFFSNSIVAIFIAMLLIFGITYGAFWIVKGKEAFVNLKSSGLLSTDSVIVKIILDALLFTTGVEVLIFGVKSMLAELVPALEGISKRWIPGAKMAVGCSVAMYYAPTGALIGFIFSFFGGIVGLVISIGLHLAAPGIIAGMIIPGIIAHFFNGGVCGSFANVRGGVVGVMLGSFINGLILTFVPIIFLAMEGAFGWSFAFGQESIKAVQWAESDFGFFSIVGWIMHLGLWTQWMILAIVLVTTGLLVIDGFLWNKKDHKKRPEFYKELKQEQLEIKKQRLDLKAKTKQINLENKRKRFENKQSIRLRKQNE